LVLGKQVDNFDYWWLCGLLIANLKIGLVLIGDLLAGKFFI
jgi:hypothetical protein